MTMMTTFIRMLCCSVLLLAASSCWAFTSSPSSTTTSRAWVLPSVVLPKSSSLSSSSALSRFGNGASTTKTELHYHRFADDHHENSEPLRMSALDVERITNMKTRGTTMPIVILDSVLPGQKYYFKSSDPKFNDLISYALSSNDEESEIGILGLHPHTGQPLNMGVTANIKKEDVMVGLTREKGERLIAASFEGKRRFEVVGTPWMDQTHSFYMADVDIVDNRHEMLPEELEEAAMELYDTIPKLVQDFVDWVVKTDRMDPQVLNKHLEEMGPLPKDVTKRAMWVGALVNPSSTPPLNVCMEIRPAMLACRNIHDRMVLAATALRASVDHMSGKRPLF